MIQASSSIGRATVSKTVGCGFNSCLACLDARTPSHTEQNGAVSSSVRTQGRGVEKLVTKSTTAKAVGQNRIVNYLQETWFELRKVSWPTRSEAVNLTLIVVSVTTFLAIVLGLMDWLFSTAFGLFI